MIEEGTAVKAAAWLARRVSRAEVRTAEGWIRATRLTAEVRSAHITLLLTIGNDILSRQDVTGVRLIDTGGDVCYTRELDLKKRDAEGATCRIDITVRVEENEHV